MRIRHFAPAFRPAVLASAVVLASVVPAAAQAQPDVQPRTLRAVGPATAQPPAGPQAPAVRMQDAYRVRDEFRALLRAHPPSLRQVLAADPGMLSNQAYLASYPAVAEFLRLHPEVVRDGAYFTEYLANSSEELTPDQRLRRESIGVWRNLMDGLGVFAVFLTVVLTLTWLIRYVMGHRRWLRATKMHADLQSRLLERFAGNEDLMAYLQSPTGRHLLTVMPSVEPVSTSSPIAAPFGRILWAIQAGVVLISGGTGLLIIRRYVIEEAGDMLLTLGVLAVSLGIGFGLASLASFVISRRLGLIETPQAPSPSS